MTTNIEETQSEIKAVKVALASFAEYVSEVDRGNFLREKFSTMPELKIYFNFSDPELKEVLSKLQEKEKVLLEKEKVLLEKEKEKVLYDSENLHWR